MADILQSHSPCSVPVGFYQPPLHSCLIDLPLLLSGPIQYALAQLGSLFRVRDVEGWQPPVNRRVTRGLLAWLFAGHLWLWWYTVTGPSTFVGVIIITVIVSTPLSSSPTCLHRHRWCWGSHHCLFLLLHHCDCQLQASYVACPRRSLLHHLRSSWLLWPRLPAQYHRCRGIFVPVDFGHGNFLSMLLLEVVDELPHLVGTPTSLAKAFCKARVSPWLIKKAVKDSVMVTWAGLVGRVRCICFFTRFGASAPSVGWGSSSEEYSTTTFLSALLPGGGFFFGVAFPLPIANGLPPVSFRAVCFVRTIKQGDLHLTFWTVKGLCFGKARSSFILRQPIT